MLSCTIVAARDKTSKGDSELSIILYPKTKYDIMFKCKEMCSVIYYFKGLLF